MKRTRTISPSLLSIPPSVPSSVRPFVLPSVFHSSAETWPEQSPSLDEKKKSSWLRCRTDGPTTDGSTFFLCLWP